MPLFQQCCCCVTLQTGGVMMGVMTLALSLFSIVPMSISLTNRMHLSRVIVYMLGRYGKQEDQGEGGTNQPAFEPMEFWGDNSKLKTIVPEGS